MDGTKNSVLNPNTDERQQTKMTAAVRRLIRRSVGDDVRVELPNDCLFTHLANIVNEITTLFGDGSEATHLRPENNTNDFQLEPSQTMTQNFAVH